MKATQIEDLVDIATLSIGIQILTGITTDRLYVPVVDFPVLDSDSDKVVGHFTFDEDTELIVFKPTAL